MSLPSGQAALTPTDHGINRLYTFGSAMVLATAAFVVVVLFQSVLVPAVQFDTDSQSNRIVVRKRTLAAVG